MLTREQGVRAVEAIFVDCFRSFAALPNGAMLESDDVTGVINDVPLAFFNGIGRTSVHSEPAAAVKRVIEIFRRRQTPFRWWISPSTEPHDLVTTLRLHGFNHVYDAGGMAADLASLPKLPHVPPDLEIRRITDIGALAQWSTVLLTVFARPAAEIALWTHAYESLGLEGPWVHYVGYANEEPVATASVLMAGRVAGVYHVATHPHARGRGYAAALTLETMRAARDAGATEIVLQSSEMGAGVYRSLGFVQYCDLTLYDWRPAT